MTNVPLTDGQKATLVRTAAMRELQKSPFGSDVRAAWVHVTALPSLALAQFYDELKIAEALS